MAEQIQSQETESPEPDQKQQMCCKGGMTSAEHRAKSPDGKCCTDK